MSSEAADGVLVGLGHRGVEGFEEEGEAEIQRGGAACGIFDGGEAAEDGAEPGEGGFGADPGDVPSSNALLRDNVAAE